MKNKIISMLSMLCVMSLSSCEEPNVFSFAAGGNDEACASDAVCFVDAIKVLTTKEAAKTRAAKAKAIGLRIVDKVTQDYVLTLAASVKAGDIVEVLEKFSNQKNYTIAALGNICPADTLADDEIDSLLASGKVQYKQMGRLCLASEAKTNVDDAEKLLADLQETLTSGKDTTLTTGSGSSIDTAAAKDMCTEFKNDENCTGLTAAELQDYLNLNF